MASIGRQIFTRLLPVLAILCSAPSAQQRVVTTIPDFADVASAIGGDAVSVVSLTEGHEDMHLVRIRPSLVIKVRRADAFVELGLDGEHAWVPAMLRTARNKRIRPGQNGFCDASIGVPRLQVPTTVSRGAGPDLHPRGNPHYNLDPTRMRIAARNIRDCLARIDPDNKPKFDKGLAAWEARLDARMKVWRKKLAPFEGAGFIEAHSSWIYFAETFGLRIVQRLEPSPGMAPSASHLKKVIAAGKKDKVGFVVGRPRFADVARRVAGDVGAEFQVLQTVSPAKGPHRGWFGYMDHVVDTFAKNLRPVKGAAKKAPTADAVDSSVAGGVPR